MRRSIVAAAILCLPLIASGGETRIWDVSRRDAFSRGEDFENLVLGSRGELRLGYESTSIDVKDEPSFWSGMISASGVTWAGTGKGAIYKIEAGKATKAFETGEMLVTTFAESGGALYAGTIPNGKIFKFDGSAWKEFAKVDAKFVWQIAAAPSGGLYAACGGEGRIFLVNAQGGSTKIFPETAESPLKCENVLCLEVDGDAIVAGTAAPGYMLRIENNKARVVYDFTDGEVKSVALMKGAWYVAVNAGAKAPPSDFLNAVEQAAKKEVAPQDPKGAPVPPPQEGDAPPTPPPAAAAGGAGVQSSIWRLSAARTERIAEFPSSYVTELSAGGDGIYVGTNNSGRVFQLFPDGSHELVFDFKEGQVLGFLESGGKVRGAFMGNRAALKHFSTDRAKKGTYVSEILDARFPTDWGTSAWRGSGKVEVHTRSGFIAKAGEGWSEWVPLKENKVASPKGRYLQFRIVIEDPAAVVQALTIAYRSENQRPRIKDLKVQTVPSRDGMNAPNPSEPGPSPRLGEGHSLLKRLQWRGEDDDNDYLIYRIYYRPAEGGAWTALLGRGSTPMPEHQWNTENIPDGRYIIKIACSDEKANPSEDVLTAEMETDPFVIDNTKPEVSVEAVDAAKVVVTVEDKASNIIRFEYSIDGGEWSSVAPKDRIFDDRKETFEFVPGKLASGSHSIVIRALDQESNVATVSKKLEVK